MKKLFTILLVFISTTVFAQPKTIFKVDIRNDKGLQQFYWENIEKANDLQVIVIPKGTLRCNSYNEYIKTYKYVLMGGRSKPYVESLDCNIMQSKSFGLVTEGFEDSQVVKLALRYHPTTKQIIHGYVGYSTVMTLKQYNNSIK
jgi:hypothetical protein